MSVIDLGKHEDAAAAEPLVAALVAHGQLVIELVWALRWLDTLSKALDHQTGKPHPLVTKYTGEMLDHAAANETFANCFWEATE